MSEHEQNHDPSSLHYKGGGIVIDKPKSEEEIAREKREEEDRVFKRDQIKTNRRLSLLTFGLVIGSFCGLGVNLWQSRISQQSADTSEKSVLLAQKAERDSRKSNEDQARQSAKTLDVSIENFQREERPWVVPNIEELVIGEDHGRFTLTVHVWAVNTGRSPAFDVYLTNAGSQTNPGQLDIDKWFKTGNRKMLSIVTDKALMVPGIPIEIHAEQVPITEKQANDIRTRALWAYTFGDIHYTDSFGAPHTTQYCFVYVPSTTRFDLCHNHNYADRDK